MGGGGGGGGVEGRGGRAGVVQTVSSMGQIFEINYNLEIPISGKQKPVFDGPISRGRSLSEAGIHQMLGAQRNMEDAFQHL